MKFCWTTMVYCRPKIIVYVSCIKFLGSCMYRYTRYTKHDVFVYRVPNSVTICIYSHFMPDCDFCPPGIQLYIYYMPSHITCIVYVYNMYNISLHNKYKRYCLSKGYKFVHSMGIDVNLNDHFFAARFFSKISELIQFFSVSVILKNFLLERQELDFNTCVSGWYMWSLKGFKSIATWRKYFVSRWNF